MPLKSFIVKSLLLLFFVSLEETATAMEYTLKDIIQFSSAIVIATPEDPPIRIQLIPHEKDLDSNLSDEFKPALEKVPPFKQVIFRFQVSESLLGDIGAGDRIEVIAADSGAQRRTHFKYYVMGMNMSNDWSRYANRHEFDDAGPRILFLRGNGVNGFEFIAPGGEGLESVDEVKRLLKQRTTEPFGFDWSH